MKNDKGRMIKILDKHNIKEVIKEHYKEIDELQAEIDNVKGFAAIQALSRRMNFLVDNVARYEQQAKTWGIEV